MKQLVLNKAILNFVAQSSYFNFLAFFLTGLCAALGFAPFHMPGLSILSLAFFYFMLLNQGLKQSLKLAFCFGLGFFGLGVSWVMVSIHDYGQLNYFFSGFITLIFIVYLALFPTLTAYCFKRLQLEHHLLLSSLSWSSLWCFGEYLRGHLMTGFPWLLIGTTQIDTPLKQLAPLLGIYGLSFLCVLSASFLALFFHQKTLKRYYYLTGFVLLIISPSTLMPIQWVSLEKKPMTVAAVQANLSMRDKWDEHLFWSLLKYYEQTTTQLLGNQLIILPEAAIPLPANYLEDYLKNMHEKTLKAHSALLLGILQPTDESETHYYNAISTFGNAQGQHIKHQLVPFGEYIPTPFKRINRWLNLPEPNVLPGASKQALIKIFNHPIASLICYEMAYPHLLRSQLPDAQWIVSISDNGWFGHSFASYQQLQMSQMLSLLVGRFQVLVNNDGLSSVIDTQGNIIDGLPSFSSGILQNVVYSASGTTPWVYWGDIPIFFICSICLMVLIRERLRLRYRKNHNPP